MTVPPHVVCIDGLNFLRRAQSGFTAGDFPVVFNFFRNLRALVEQQKPTRVFFVLEGHPKFRYDILPSYKATRKIVLPTDGSDPDPKILKKIESDKEFYRQVDLALDLLKRRFPVSVVRHPHLECDDVIGCLVRASSRAVPWTIVSSDSDFVQLLDLAHVKVWNPMKKSYLQRVDYDYVTWKALRGDGCDNVDGIAGIGDKKATALCRDKPALDRFLADPAIRAKFDRNVKLVRFHSWTPEEAAMMTSSQPESDWEEVGLAFKAWDFNSITRHPSWPKFIDTFEPLWGG